MVAPPVLYRIRYTEKGSTRGKDEQAPKRRPRVQRFVYDCGTKTVYFA